MSDPFSLAGKVALVTGASRGLGWGVAQSFAEAGALVVLNGRDQTSLDERVADLETRGFEAATARFDVGDREAAAAALDGIIETHGQLDILVNNAGNQHREPILEVAYEDWIKIIDTHLNAAFALSQRAARHMVERGRGRIINIASVMGPQARATVPGYTAAKGGLAALTRALAVELGKEGVTCNAIGPGYIKTELTDALAKDPEFDRFLSARSPVPRWGKPEEIGAAALFLASDAAAYVNGHVLFVDGGLSIAI